MQKSLVRAMSLRFFLALTMAIGLALFVRHFSPLKWAFLSLSRVIHGPAIAAEFPASTHSMNVTVQDTMPRVFTQLWSTASPLRTTVAQQTARGATIVPHTYMDSLWNQGIADNGTAAGIPIYVAKTSDPLLTTICTKFGGTCNAKNVRIHVPSYAVAQQISDGHLIVVDQSAPAGPIEIDCWQATTSDSHFQCSWAGVYRLGSAGIAQDGSEGIHGGMAVTSVFITGQELLNGHIEHALGMNTSCLNNSAVYPADMTNGTDAACDRSTNPPHYGNLMHLLWSSSQIKNSTFSAPCKAVLTALAVYGAYLDDTGNNGLQINTQNEMSYSADPDSSSKDPWPTIQAALNSAGDGSGNNWNSCLNRLQSSDFELIQIARP